MTETYTVPLKTIVREHEFTVLHPSSDFDTAEISSADLNRPGLQLAGFYDYFDPCRIQMIGKVETTYLMGLPAEERYHRLARFLSYKPAAVIVCHGSETPEELLTLAEAYDVCLLYTSTATSEIMAQLIGTLRGYLAPRFTRHGVLVEVHGEGMLIVGDSGIGKSETALELIKRGHRLIADDAVEIRRTSRTTLVGSAPKIIRYYMELRGIGVIDVRHIYGVGSVKPAERIDLVVQLEHWDENKKYDRLGLETHYTEMLGVSVPCITIPVGPGRNLAVILELAAMNNRQKKMGYNAAENLVAKHDELIDLGLSY